MRKFLIFIVACLSHLSVATAADPPIQIVTIGFAGAVGAMYPSNLSFSIRDAAQLAIDEANDRKIQIAGKLIQFKLLVADDQADVNFAKIAANSLVAAHVVGVIGHNTTDTSIAAAKIYNEAGIPMITPTSTGRALIKLGYRTTFQLLGDSDVTVGYLTDIALDTMNGKRIAIIDNGNTLANSLADTFTKRVHGRQGLVVARESTGGKTSDFNGPLKGIEGKNVDVVFFTGTGPQAIAFAESYKRGGIQAKLLLTGAAVNSEFPRTGNYPDDVYLLLHGAPMEKYAGYPEFAKNYKRRFSSTINAYTIFSYDATNMLIEAFRRANSLDPQKAVDELHSMQYTGLSGTISFLPDGTQNKPPYTLYRSLKQIWHPIKEFKSR